MRFHPLLALALSPPAAGFLAAPAATRTSVRTSRLGGEESPGDALGAEADGPLPARRIRGPISELTTSQLPALTELKRGGKPRMVRPGDKGRHNRQRLLKMGITTSMALSASLARPGASWAVAAEAVSALVGSAPGLGIARMPGLPDKAAVDVSLRAVALTLCLLTALVPGLARLAWHLDGAMAREEDEGEIDPGLPRETSWGAYARSALDPLREKVPEGGAARRRELNRFTMLFEPVEEKPEADPEAEEAKLRRASVHFRERKRRQHRRAARAAYEPVSYLVTPRGDVGVRRILAANEEVRRDVPLSYSDMLSGAGASRSTWGAYGRTLDGASPRPEGEAGGSKPVHTSYLDTLAVNEGARHDVPPGYLDTLSGSCDGRNRNETGPPEVAEELEALDRRAKDFEETVMRCALRAFDRKVVEIEAESSG